MPENPFANYKPIEANPFSSFSAVEADNEVAESNPFLQFSPSDTSSKSRLRKFGELAISPAMPASMGITPFGNVAPLAFRIGREFKRNPEFAEMAISPVMRAMDYLQRPTSGSNVLYEAAIEDLKRNPESTMPASMGITPFGNVAPLAFRIGRELKRNPEEIGERIKRALSGEEIVTGSDVLKKGGISNLPSGTLPRVGISAPSDRPDLKALELASFPVTGAINVASSAAEKQGTIGGFVFDAAKDPLNWLAGGAITAGAKWLSKATGLSRLTSAISESRFFQPVKTSLGKMFIAYYGFPEAYAALKKISATRLRNGIGEVIDSFPKARKEVEAAAKRLGKPRAEIDRAIVDFVENPKINASDVPEELRGMVFKLKQAQKTRPIRELAAGVPAASLGSHFESEIVEKLQSLEKAERRYSNTLIKNWSKKTKAINGNMSALEAKRKQLADLLDTSLSNQDIQDFKKMSGVRSAERIAEERGALKFERRITTPDPQIQRIDNEIKVLEQRLKNLRKQPLGEPKGIKTASPYGPEDELAKLRNQRIALAKETQAERVHKIEQRLMELEDEKQYLADLSELQANPTKEQLSSKISSIDNSINRLTERHISLTNQVNEALEAKNFPLARRIKQQVAELQYAQANEIDYFIHVMSKEAKEALAKARPNIVGIVGREFKVKNPSMLRRAFTHADGTSMSISEVNQLAREGKLNILGNKKIGQFFIEDPVIADGIREIRSIRSIESANFYNKVKEFAVKDGVETTVPELKGLKFPKEIADDLVKVQQRLSNVPEVNSLINKFDKLQNIWKGYMTSVNPGFHIRNAYSNMFQNYLAGLTDLTKYIEAADIVTPTSSGKFVSKSGSVFSYEDIRRAMLEEGVINHGFFASGELGDVAEQSISQAIGAKRFRPTVIGRKVGGAIENNARVALFLDGVDKGMTFRDAGKRVQKYLFDYTELTDVERHILRRGIPFYTWMRKNLPLQVEQIIENPQKYARLAQAKYNIEGENRLSEKELKAVPEFVRERFIIALPSKEKGVVEVLNLALPVEDLNLLKPLYTGRRFTENLREAGLELMSRMTPAIKGPFESLFGVSTFTGRPLESQPGKLVDIPGYMRALPDPVLKGFGIQEGRYGMKMSPVWRNLIDSFVPPSIKVIPADKKFRNLDEKKRFERYQASRFMGYVAGMRIFPIDVRQGLMWHSLDIKKDIQRERNRLRSLAR